MKIIQSIFNNKKSIAFADQAVVSAGSFATTILLAKTLGLKDFGVFSGFVLFQIFILSVNSALTSNLFQVIFPSLDLEKKESYKNGMIFFQSILSVCIAIISVIVYFVLPSTLSIYKIFIPIYSMNLVLFLVNDLIRKIFLTQGNFRMAFIFDATNYFLQLVLLTILYFLGILNLYNAFIVITITFIPGIFYSFYELNLATTSYKDLIFVFELHKGKTKWILGSSLLQWTSGYFFVIAAGWWLGAAALGALRLAQHIFGLLNILLQAIENYAIPKAVESKTKKAFYHKLMLICLAIMLPLIIVLAVFTKPIMLLAGGNSYIDYMYVMYGLAIIYILMTISYPIRIAIRSEQLNQHYFIGYLMTMLFSLSTFYALINTYHLIGVLLGLFSTQFILLAYWSIILKKHKFI